MDAQTIIFEYFEFDNNSDLNSLMKYLDIDTLVAWFVDEGYVDYLEEDEEEVVREHYDLHC